MTQNFLLSQLKLESEQKDTIIQMLLAAIRQMVADQSGSPEARKLAKVAIEAMNRSGLYPGE